MPGNQLKLVISVKDDGSVVVDTVKGKIKDLGDTTKKASEEGGSALGIMKAGWLELAAGVTAGYFTIKKGIDVITDLVNVTAEAEQIEKRAAFQIETWGYKFQEIKPFVDAFAESIMRTTRFSDEMARQGLGQIMQFTSSVEEGMRGVQIAMDMSTQTGQDLNSTIRLVGMAMGGNLEILGRWIPELRNLDETLGANASQAEKASYAMEVLNKKFSGAAQADLNTYAGQVANLKNDWDEIKENIGRALMPYAEQWILGTKSLLSGFSQVAAKTKEEINAVAEATKKAAEQAARIPVIGVAPPEKDWIKKWVEDFDDLTYSYEKLGIISQKTLSESAASTLMYMESVKKAYREGRASVSDYMNAIKAANDALKKVVGEDITSKLVGNEEEYQKRIRAISADDPDRQKKVQAAIDDWQKARSEIEKMKISVHADISPAEAEIRSLISKVEAQGINLKVNIESTGSMTGGGEGGTSWTDYVSGNTEFFQGGKKAVDDMNDSFQDWSDQWGKGLDVPISIYGIGSSKKPITEKIKEIIGEFGGLEKAMTGMEAEINVAELSMQYQKLDAKLKQVERIIPDMSAMASWAGGSPYVGGPIIQTVTDLIADYTEQMKIIQMKILYEMTKMYGGSMQTGGYVSATGLYTLHEGEKVSSRNQTSMGPINIGPITVNGARDPKETANEIIQIIKYNLNTELTTLLSRRG